MITTKMRFWITCLLTSLCLSGWAQTAKSVLDKAAQVVANKSGVTASFTLSSGQKGNASGTISVKGRKFYAKTSAGTVWFDGKTQWTYVPQNDEVNINTPSASELQSINPYAFIYLYRQGYTLSMKTSGQNYIVTMKAANKGIQQMVITLSRQSYVPSQVRMLQNKRWTTINISNFKRANLSDALFRFNPKSYPHAEIIDLR